MIPLYLDDTAAAFHPASGTRGVVLVGTWGFEDLCAHRAMNALAEDLAAAGCPTLRLDLHGTGDSGGDTASGEKLTRWTADVCAAARWLQTQCGVTEIALAGFRLGALVALEASHHMDVARLALLAPPRSGRAYLREAQVLARVIARDAPSAGGQGLELAGFHLDGDTVNAISALRLVGPVRGRHVLIAAPAIDDTLGAYLDKPDMDIERIAFEGYEQLMCDPTASIVPKEQLRAFARWVSADSLPARATQAAPDIDTVRHTPDYHEEFVTFGQGLSGVLCATRKCREAIILLNAGAIRRSGWARLHVDAARALAPAGIATLRFDFSYMQSTAASALPHLYDATLLAEVKQAVDCLSTRGYKKIGVAGLCSGAYNALQAALADPRLSRIVLVNQLSYAWEASQSAPLALWAQQKASDVARKKRAADPAAGELTRINARLALATIGLAKTLAKALLRRLRHGSQVLKQALAPQPRAQGDVIGWLRELAARDVRIDIAISDADGSALEFEQRCGPNGAALRDLPQVHVTRIAATDHLLTPPAARQCFLDILRAAPVAAQLHRAA